MSNGTWRFLLEVNVTDPPLVAMMVAAEHLMTAVAMQSAAGFENGLELLCQGARSNKVKMFQGHRTDQ